MPDRSQTAVVSEPRQLLEAGTRRRFLKLMGVGGAVVLMPALFSACHDSTTGPGSGGAVTLDLSTDAGILNYAYALEQLEAAFYSQVVSGFAANGISQAAERDVLTQIRNHEMIHRDFLKAALGSAAIPALAVDFGNALASRDSVLTTARTFEDLGVAAYNGAGKYLEDGAYLLLAGKIVSVEARHAAAIRDILDSTGRAFAGDDVVDSQGLDRAFEPDVVLANAGPFITTTVAIGTQPS